MTPREIKRIKRTLDTLEAGFTRRALQHFASILPETEPFVEDVLRTGNVDDFAMPGKKRYLVLFKRYIQECFVQGMNLTDQELLARQARFDDQKQQPPPVIPEEAMAWMDRWTERFGPDYYGDLTQDVVSTLKRSLAEGLSVEHTMDQLEHVLTGPAYNKNRLDVIARTNATTAFNQGRLEMFNQDPDFVPYVEFLAILDSRTTDICEARNGKIFRTGSADLAANTPPLHYRCRSILSPVTIYDLEDMQKAGWKDPEGKTLQQKMDLSGMPELPKGFGSVGRMLSDRPERIETVKDRRLPMVEKRADGEGRGKVPEYIPDDAPRKIIVKGNASVTLIGHREGEDVFIEHLLDKVPSEHIAGVKSIYATNNFIFVNADGKDYVAAADYSIEEKTIALSRKFRNWNPSKESNAYEIDKNQSFFTLAHEIGHHVHENLLPDGLKTQIWAAAQKDGFVVLGNYDPDKEPPPSVYEYFANSYAYWLNPEDKDQLYINHNEVYNILESIFRRTQ